MTTFVQCHIVYIYRDNAKTIIMSIIFSPDNFCSMAYSCINSAIAKTFLMLIIHPPGILLFYVECYLFPEPLEIL